MKSAVTLAPQKIVYISCDPQTQARDLKYLTKHGYKAMGAYPYDMFPFTKHAENTCVSETELNLSKRDIRKNR